MFSRILFSIRLMTPLAPESSGIDVESEQNGQRKLHPAQHIMNDVCIYQSKVEKVRIRSIIIFNDRSIL